MTSCVVLWVNYDESFMIHLYFHLLILLEDTARYAGLLLAPAEGFGLFLPFAQKSAYYVVLALFGVQ